LPIAIAIAIAIGHLPSPMAPGKEKKRKECIFASI
jgi:hypothetical protein